MIIEQDCQIKTNFDFVTHSALMTFDNQTQQFGGKFEMSTYFYSNVIWLELGSKIATLNTLSFWHNSHKFRIVTSSNAGY